MKATCSIGFLDCGVSLTGFVLARLFLEIPSDEVNSVCVVPGPTDPSFLVLSDFRPIDLLILLSTRTQERRMFRVTESAEPVCVSTGRRFRRDCILVRIPSDMTRLNHDFSGQFAFPLSEVS